MPEVQPKKFYVFVEDFPHGLVGPFLSRDMAELHIERHRYGSSHYEVISGCVAKWIEDDVDFFLTPEEDIEYKKQHHSAIERGACGR